MLQYRTYFSNKRVRAVLKGGGSKRIEAECEKAPFWNVVGQVSIVIIPKVENTSGMSFDDFEKDSGLEGYREQADRACCGATCLIGMRGLGGPL